MPDENVVLEWAGGDVLHGIPPQGDELLLKALG
jgi:hypothetical protein